ncbi:MAG: efflux RND transporter periplasmic adaptor subunit [Alphaproteobacteria bacterium]|nr:efflux RND transporter periplasmic adaptor subunit [Alphaproteobacteria bacterium]
MASRNAHSKQSYPNKSVADSWRFHLSVRLIALVVIMLSAYVIIMSKEQGHKRIYLESQPEHPSLEISAVDGVFKPNIFDATTRTVKESSGINGQEDFVDDTTSVSQVKLSKIYEDKEKTVPEDQGFSRYEPASGEDGAEEKTGEKTEEKSVSSEWAIEENTLSVDTVLVPKKETVISSSRDGKLSDIPFQNGDKFSKGDILVRYDCADLQAEAEMAGYEKELTGKKTKSGKELFKLDIISDIDRLSLEGEDKQAAAKLKLYEARLNDCTIKADFDGRVTKRLANIGEYTRTDRVLLEVVSNDPLHAEFLLPSKWLRWINVGAPVSIDLNETGRTYTAKVIRIHGEVDPISRSIQVRAALDGYNDPLLPGMSGTLRLDIENVQKAGVVGYLSQKGR